MAEVEFAYAGKPDSGGNVAIRRRTEETGYTPSVLAEENALLRAELAEARALLARWVALTKGLLNAPEP